MATDVLIRGPADDGAGAVAGAMVEPVRGSPKPGAVKSSSQRQRKQKQTSTPKQKPQPKREGRIDERV